MERILVIVDMQIDFLTGTLGNAACAATLPQVLEKVRTGSYDRIFLTQDTHTEDYKNTREGRNLPVEHCIRGTEGWQIHPEVMAAVEKYGPREPGRVHVFQKPTFGSTELAAELAALYEKDKELQIDFVGVCTGICVISNVLLAKANCPEAEIRVFAQACACVTPQSHEQALGAMKLCQITVE